MTESQALYTPEELIGCLSLINISKSLLHSEKLSETDVNGVQFTAEIANATEPNVLKFKIVYKLRLLSGPLKANLTDVDTRELKADEVSPTEEMPSDVGILEATAIVTFQVVNPPRPGWEESVMLANGLAIMAAHPYLREALANSAQSIGYPPITLGLLRAGVMTPDSVAVGQRVYPFSND